jgi:hypothetical protein
LNNFHRFEAVKNNLILTARNERPVRPGEGGPEAEALAPNEAILFKLLWATVADDQGSQALPVEGIAGVGSKESPPRQIQIELAAQLGPDTRIVGILKEFEELTAPVPVERADFPVIVAD